MNFKGNGRVELIPIMRSNAVPISVRTTASTERASRALDFEDEEDHFPLVKWND